MVILKLSELKADFYKRYRPSDNYLHFTANGILCSLLGHSDIPDAPSLSCTLSMRVQMFARKLDGKVVKVQSSASDKYLTYDFSDTASLYRGIDRETINIINTIGAERLNGAEILYECSIPEFLPRKEPFNMSLAQSLMKISGIEADIAKTAAFASCGENTGVYLALAAAKSGYCTYISSGVPKNYPLPMTGYKIVSAHCTEKDIDRSKEIRYAFNAVRRMYPHAGSIADITMEMFNNTKNMIKDKTALRYMYHLVNENKRIENAIDTLKRCNAETLFEEMTKSEKSMERYWDIGSEHVFLARCARDIEGVKAVRVWNNGIVAITEDDKIDYAIGMIRDEFEENIGYQPTFCISDAG